MPRSSWNESFHRNLKLHSSESERTVGESASKQVFLNSIETLLNSDPDGEIEMQIGPGGRNEIPKDGIGIVVV